MAIQREDTNEGICLKFDGKITVYEAASLCRELKEYVDADSNILAMDLGKVAECDTAGIQLLCSVMKTCLCRGNEIVFENVPLCVTQIAENLGLELDRVNSQLKEDIQGKGDHAG